MKTNPGSESGSKWALRCFVTLLALATATFGQWRPPEGEPPRGSSNGDVKSRGLEARVAAGQSEPKAQLAHVVSASASRNADKGINIAIDTIAFSGGWRWFGEHSVNGNTLEVYARAIGPRGAATTNIEKGKLEIEIREGVESVERVAIHGAVNRIDIVLGEEPRITQYVTCNDFERAKDSELIRRLKQQPSTIGDLARVKHAMATTSRYGEIGLTIVATTGSENMTLIGVAAATGNTLDVYVEQRRSASGSDLPAPREQRIQMNFRHCIDGVDRLVVHGSNGPVEIRLKKSIPGNPHRRARSRGSK